MLEVELDKVYSFQKTKVILFVLVTLLVRIILHFYKPFGFLSSLDFCSF